MSGQDTDGGEHPCRCKRYMVQFNRPGFRDLYIQECFEVPSRYEIDEKEAGLGVGAYGAVVKAYDTVTGKHVAIKKWKELFDPGQPLRTKSSLRELKLLRHFSSSTHPHPNILQAHEIFIPLGNPDDSTKSYLERRKEFNSVYVVLDLYSFSLKQLLTTADLQNPLGEEYRGYFMFQLLHGLKAMFRASCVHRDLKPENILINIEDSSLCICDLGSARGYEADIDTGITNLYFTTTQWYSPPESFLECLQNKPDLETQVIMPNPQSVDIWACGVILAELMLGEPLLPGKGEDHIGQLTLIFTKVAPITEEDINKLNFRSKELKRIMLDISRAGRSANVRKLFDGKLDKAGKPYSSRELDMLEAMLQIDPCKRVTIDEALEFPYFEDFPPPEEEEEQDPAKFEFRFDADRDAREDIWEEYEKDNKEVKEFFDRLILNNK